MVILGGWVFLSSEVPLYVTWGGVVSYRLVGLVDTFAEGFDGLVVRQLPRERERERERENECQRERESKREGERERERRDRESEREGATQCSHPQGRDRVCSACSAHYRVHSTPVSVLFTNFEGLDGRVVRQLSGWGRERVFSTLSVCSVYA